MSDQTSKPAPAQAGNELYFTSGTRRAQRIGRVLVLVTEGARITVTLPARDGEPTSVAVAADAGVKVTKSVRKPQASKPAPKAAARKQPAGAAK